VRRAVAVGVAVAAAVLLLSLIGSGAVGTDQQAAATAADRAPDYDRWVAPVWTPPGPWGERLLFGLQAGIGGAVLVYYLGRLRADSGATGEP
jgi:cobalt transport protein